MVARRALPLGAFLAHAYETAGSAKYAAQRARACAKSKGERIKAWRWPLKRRPTHRLWRKCALTHQTTDSPRRARSVVHRPIPARTTGTRLPPRVAPTSSGDGATRCAWQLHRPPPVEFATIGVRCDHCTMDMSPRRRGIDATSYNDELASARVSATGAVAVGTPSSNLRMRTTVANLIWVLGHFPLTFEGDAL